jgi:adenine-specific DNA methylase
MTSNYPKRLIEVDLPIARISAHARREKSIRHGHISTLHIWWARRPLAACRAVICAALWPDPVDAICPQKFRNDAFRILSDLQTKVEQGMISADRRAAEEAVSRMTFAKEPNAHLELRKSLLDFIAEFANWDLSTNSLFLEASRALTQSAHESLGGEPGTRPLVVDPFAGGGSIPLEALRVGADAFASDLNPIPVLLNKVVLEYIPTYGQRLADEVRKWGDWIKKEAEKELAEFYPKDPDGATPIAYLWARTIQCEGPGCGAEVPLIRSLWLAKKSNRSVALQIVPDKSLKKVDFRIIVKQGGNWVDQANPQTIIESPKFDGTVKRCSGTCPCCGFTTPVARVREQLKLRHGGTSDARLLTVVCTKEHDQGRFYRLPTQLDLEVSRNATKQLENASASNSSKIKIVPDEKICLNEIRRISVPLYGINTWGDLFTARQALTLVTLTRLVRTAGDRVSSSADFELVEPIQTCLSFLTDKMADKASSLCRWKATAEYMGGNTFGRQALGMVWDFCEASVLGKVTGDITSELEWLEKVLSNVAASIKTIGVAQSASATAHPLPDDSANAFITDPPYYDAVPYAHLSDFFYTWIKRNLEGRHSSLLGTISVPKEEEIVVDRPHELSNSNHDIAFYERELTKAIAEGRRVVRPDGVGTIVFASKTTASWEALLKGVVDAGWIITGSWPIDTEMESRVAAQGQARLGSSVHLVCRPRENPDGSEITNDAGDWRDVLAELPRRIHEWMPRLASEGVVGADAIFACLGPALEVFSRYSRVEKANGEQVTLKEYLEHVWAAVSNEALSMIFKDADASGLEPDARLTAMWLWTLGAAKPGSTETTEPDGEDPADSDDDDGEKAPKGKVTGFSLEYDAARKIAQGLGIHLEKAPSVVEVKGDQARLLPVGERTRYLFGKEAVDPTQAPKRRKKQEKQLDMFAALEMADAAEDLERPDLKAPSPGDSVLDRVHQAMILFGAGRAEALKRFLVEDGVGKDPRFWKLAQSLSALYPGHIEEKRWVDGVLARKKSFGY